MENPYCSCKLTRARLSSDVNRLTSGDERPAELQLHSSWRIPTAAASGEERTRLPRSPCLATPFGVKTASPLPSCAGAVPPARPLMDRA